MIEIWKSFTFDAAHYLPRVPDGHKCKRLHGHTYHVEIRIGGAVDIASGMVRDLADIATAWAPLDAQLDHQLLNDIGGLSNPTGENLAAWIADRLMLELPELSRITVNETPSSGAVFYA